MEDQIWPVLRGLLCRHINRSSPVFAILCVILGGQLGWIFYVLAIVQYLIIGLVTSRDKAFNALSAHISPSANRTPDSAPDDSPSNAALADSVAATAKDDHVAGPPSSLSDPSSSKEASAPSE